MKFIISFSTLAASLAALHSAEAKDRHSNRSLEARMDAKIDALEAKFHAKNKELHSKNKELHSKNKELSSKVASLESKLMAKSNSSLRGRSLKEDEMMSFGSYTSTILEQLHDITQCVSYQSSGYEPINGGTPGDVCFFGSSNAGTTFTDYIVVESDVDVEIDAAQDLDIDADTGEIDIDASDGIQITTDDGDILIETTDDGDIDIEAYGDVVIDASYGSIDMVSDTGDIDIDADEDILIDTFSGDINIEASTSVHIVAEGDDNDDAGVFIAAEKKIQIESNADTSQFVSIQDMSMPKTEKAPKVPEAPESEKEEKGEE